MKPRFQFGNIVVVDDDQIGVIVKTWNWSLSKGSLKEFNYDVYVRSRNLVKEYTESDINHYVYSKELSEDEKEFY